MITKFKKHPFIWSIVGVGIVGILISIGLTNHISSSSTDTKVNFIEKVKTLEENEYAFKKLNITYEEFEENTKEIRPENYDGTYIDEDFVYTGPKDGTLNFYDAKDLKNLTEEELKEHQNILQKVSSVNYEIGYENSEIILKISNPYETSDENEKVVFVQKSIEFDEDIVKKMLGVEDVIKLPRKTYLNKRYTFKKQDGEWKFVIRNIDMKHITFEEFKKTENEKELIKDMKLNTINDERVEYNTVINLE